MENFINDTFPDNSKSSRSYIRQSNLELALMMAIECRQEEERKMKYGGDSALLAGWKENLAALKQGKLEIR